MTDQAKKNGLTVVQLGRILILVTVIAIPAAIICQNYLDYALISSGRRAIQSIVRTDQRSLATAIEAYYVDHKRYPVSATGADSVNGARFKHPELLRIPSFQITRGRSGVETLTTPVSYISKYPVDPFAPEKGATFGYYSAGINDALGWILISPGPDKDYDIDPAKVYNPSVEQPSPELLVLTYDPTNGAVSDGDMWRVKQ